MNGRRPEVLELEEYMPCYLPQGRLSLPQGEQLWRHFSPQVCVEFPSPKTGGQWRLVAQGWAGYIPLGPDLGIRLLPKLPIGNLFQMLEVAYRSQSLALPDGLLDCASLEAFYARLARLLACRVLRRARRGLYRVYLPETSRRPFVRGRIDVTTALRQPWDGQLPCQDAIHTADVEDNRILLWTLRSILRSGVCTERTLLEVRQACRTLQGAVTLAPYSSLDCAGRAYNRLNQDYAAMHALCRFFLDHRGPSHHSGDREVDAFLVDMARLFESFVVEWLAQRLPAPWGIRAQERVSLGAGRDPHFDIDMVLYQTATGEPRCVLDTKYKAGEAPAADDIAQVVAYAEAKGCREAVLVYPIALSRAFDVRVGAIRVRSLAFVLDGDLETEGEWFMNNLLSPLSATF